MNYRLLGQCDIHDSHISSLLNDFCKQGNSGFRE